MNNDWNNESKENKPRLYSFYDLNNDSELVFFSLFESYSNIENMKKKNNACDPKQYSNYQRYDRNSKRMKPIVLFDMFLGL